VSVRERARARARALARPLTHLCSVLPAFSCCDPRRQGGKAYMLEACDPRSVYCNTLDDFAPLAEGRCSLARLRIPVLPPRSRDTRATSLRLLFVTDEGWQTARRPAAPTHGGPESMLTPAAWTRGSVVLATVSTRSSMCCLNKTIFSLCLVSRHNWKRCLRRARIPPARLPVRSPNPPVPEQH
jgi:hypothetical protein